jgi:hypothetical protein
MSASLLMDLATALTASAPPMAYLEGSSLGRPYPQPAPVSARNCSWPASKGSESMNGYEQ